MALINVEDCLFLIIDIQEKLLNAVFNKNIVQKNSEILAHISETLGIPVVLTEQYPKGLGKTVNSVSKYLHNNILAEKTSFNALENSEIEISIQKSNKKIVVVFGIETHICVYQTVAALIKNGYDVILINDACGSRSEVEHSQAVHIIERLGASVKTTEMLLFELLKSSKHPKFKEIQALIK